MPTRVDGYRAPRISHTRRPSRERTVFPRTIYASTLSKTGGYLINSMRSARCTARTCKDKMRCVGAGGGGGGRDGEVGWPRRRELADYSIRDELSVSRRCISGEQIRVIRGAPLSPAVSHSAARRYYVHAIARVSASRPLNRRSGTGLEQRGQRWSRPLSLTERYFLRVGTYNDRGG